MSLAKQQHSEQRGISGEKLFYVIDLSLVYCRRNNAFWKSWGGELLKKSKILKLNFHVDFLYLNERIKLLSSQSLGTAFLNMVLFWCFAYFQFVISSWRNPLFIKKNKELISKYKFFIHSIHSINQSMTDERDRIQLGYMCR